jgi:hypothetical protein
MAHGFQVFDQIGELGSTSKRIGRILGQVSHDTSGTYTLHVPDFDPLRGFYYTLREADPSNELFGAPPDISWDGSTKTITVTPNGAMGTVLIGMNK